MDGRESKELMARLNRDAARIAARFGLRYRSIEAERANVKRRYGVCFSDGSIRIRLRHASTGRPLKYSSLVNTLCHELAHLRHFDHGPRFKAFYLAILEWARREGIYRPGRGGVDPVPRPAAPAARVAASGRSHWPPGHPRGIPERPRAAAAQANASAAPVRPRQLDLFG